MYDYLHGTDILGAAGAVYTDRATVLAVQKALEKKGYFHGVVDGKYGSVTNAAILNFSGQPGPPNDELLLKLGVKPPGAKSVSFADDEVDSMVVQAKTAKTPAQVQIVAAKIEDLAPPELKAQAASARQEAARATTPEQVAKAQMKVTAVAEAMKPGMPAWKIALIAVGTVCAVGTVGLASSLTSRPRTV